MNDDGRTDVEEESWAAPLEALIARLRELHRALLEAGERAYEWEHGPLFGAGALLQAAAHHPAFSFLRPISELIVDLTELGSEGLPIRRDEAAAIRADVAASMSPDESSPDADEAKLAALLAEAPRAQAERAQVLAALQAFPAGAPPADEAARLHAVHRWAAARHPRGRHGGA